jgi:FkbM family methyltransferase
MTLQAHAEDLLCRTRLYRPVRNTYQRVLNRDYYRERVEARAFFRPFVNEGDLVFDLGANRGLRAELFLELGARVVAVEPIPLLAALIERRYHSPKLAVESCAVGPQPGTATLHIGTDDLHSTISDRWVQTVHDDPNLPERWSSTIEVPVRTLNDLIADHGLPSFVKMDIEGFEAEALAGLDHAPRGLSFEFQCPDLPAAERCFSRLAELGTYRYRTAPGEEFAWMDGDWTDDAGIMARLERLREQDPITHGDVYAVLSQD